ncbi:unnamed protein product, partial [Symbiodinium sp. KB8]
VGLALHRPARCRGRPPLPCLPLLHAEQTRQALQKAPRREVTRHRSRRSQRGGPCPFDGRGSFEQPKGPLRHARQ